MIDEGAFRFVEGKAVCNNQEIEHHKKIINNMSHLEMASLYRFAPAGHIYFNTTEPLHEYFTKRFRELGGMTPRISKQIGWDN